MQADDGTSEGRLTIKPSSRSWGVSVRDCLSATVESDRE
jgi:hypothetical protein